MVQHLRTSVVFPEDPGLIPSTHVEVGNCLYLQIQIEYSPLFWPPSKLHAYDTQTQKRQNIYTINNKL